MTTTYIQYSIWSIGLYTVRNKWFYNIPMHLHRVNSREDDTKIIYYCVVCGWEKTELSTGR
jgi:hypothetical protein